MNTNTDKAKTNETQKHILIDLDRLREPTSGLGHVALYFGQKLAQRATLNPDLKFTFLVPSQNVGCFGNAVDYVECSALLKIFPFLHKKYDLWYCPHQDIAFPPVSGARFILTINDLNFVHEKSPARVRSRLHRIQKFINRSSIITVISSHTGEEVRQHLQLQNRPMHVISAGLELKSFPNVEHPQFMPQKPYLLTVGVHKKTKNYEALLGLMENLPEFDLVMLGQHQTPAGEEFLQKVRERNLESRIHLRGIVSDEDKYWYYKNSRAVLFPSISEGMGYPPLEAMQARKPVFVFRKSAVPEVCGPHALYWSSNDAQIMASETIEKLKEYDSHPNMAEAAYAHGMSFGWDPVVEKYLQLFRDFLK